MMRKRNGGNSKSKDGPQTKESADSSNSSPKSQEEALQSKNYRLAKELSEVRVRQREESKNVTRLTMENMNLASRCREAIAQAASLKKELIAQKRKTGEAVSQTHQLLSELKKMKNNGSPDRKGKRQNHNNDTPSVATEATDDISKSPESISTKSTLPTSTPEDDYQTDESEPKNHDPRTPNGLVSSDDYEPPSEHEVSPKPDAPASFEEDSEEQDTVPDTIAEKAPSLPATSSPNVVRRFPGVKESGSYDEEYPSDLSCQSTKTTSRSLLSSIDAFEASFKTNFPKSFTPKEGESNAAYDPFDTNSPQKRLSDPPGDAPNSPSRFDRSPRDTLPNDGKILPKLEKPKSSDPRKQLLSRNAKVSAAPHQEHASGPIVAEKLADRFQKSIDINHQRLHKREEPITPTIGTESMVSRMKKSLAAQTTPSPTDAFVKAKGVRTNTTSLSPPIPVNENAEKQERTSSRSPVDPPKIERTLSAEDVPSKGDDVVASRFKTGQRTAESTRYSEAQEVTTRYEGKRTKHHRSISAPRGFSPEQPAANFASTRAHYERTARTLPQNDGEIPMQSSIPAKARVTRSWQRPKALLLAGDDDTAGFRQRRNVNLSKVARRPDFGGGASPLVTSPKAMGR